MPDRLDVQSSDLTSALQRGEPTHPPPWFIAAATMGVAGVPVLAALTLLVAVRPRADLAVILAVTLGLALAASVVGQAIWSRRPESKRFALGDLMVWNAIRRKNAEHRVERKAHLLGFDLDGRFAGHARVPTEQQLPVARDISRALEIKSTYSRSHSTRVERHARRMAKALELDPEDIEQLALAATLHDIGNIKISDHLLRKPETLTPEERETVEGHVLLGAAMAFASGSPAVVGGVRHHHEHWDGSGYPSGLAGDEIPLFARIIAIAAAYEAMTSPRAYRRAFSRDHALEIMRSHGGHQFDPELVETFITTLSEQRVPAFIPLFALPIHAAGQVRASLRRVTGGTAAAAIASTAAVILLGTAIMGSGTFSLPSQFLVPRVESVENGSVVVELEGSASDNDSQTEDEGVVESTTLAGVGAGDTVLGIRVNRGDGLPPEGVVGTPPIDPGPGPGPGPTPGPEPTPEPPVGPPPPGPGGPSVGPTPPTPGVDFPGKGKNKGKGHAYGHDHGPTHPGQINGAGHDKGKNKEGNPSNGNSGGKPGDLPGGLGGPGVPDGPPDNGPSGVPGPPGILDGVPGNATGHDKNKDEGKGPDGDHGGGPSFLDSLIAGTGPE